MNKYRELSEKLTPEQNRLWAIACAELVLPIFEEKYPNEDRPRLAIEAAKNKSPDVAYVAARAAAAAWVAAPDAVFAAACAARAAARAAYWAAPPAASISAAFADAAHHAYAAAYHAEQAGASKEEILQLWENIREQV